MTAERHSFQAEVARLLHMMVHSVYSERDVFLRELVSNASDACDKLRYEAVSAHGLIEQDTTFRIVIAADKEAGILHIADNGIGMTKADLVDNLGTIARSGTADFVQRLGEAKAGAEAGLIGQFGVGFYSGFMVADKIEVRSRRAGTPDTYLWTSDGTGDFTVEETALPHPLLGERGTVVSLRLKPGEEGYLEPERLKGLVRKYSDHIGIPIEVRAEPGGEGETANSASALWTRPRSEISEDQYKEFYHHVAQAFDAPWATIHYKAEGRTSFTALLFIPETPPFDLFDPSRSGRIKLYVNRVYITDEAPLLPGYLRFVRGVVDSADMPLNISREMLQNNPIVAQLRRTLTGRILSELEKAAKADAERFATVMQNFGPVIKEGIYEDKERRDDLLGLVRFRTTAGENWRSLAEIVADFKPNQTAIYYLLGEDAEKIARSPQLEGFRARGIEVLLLSDPVDGFWTTAVEGFEGKPFRSITRGASDLDAFAPETPAEESKAETGALIDRLKELLQEEVAEVRASTRLTDSPACLVAGDYALDMRLERFLASHGQIKGGLAKRVLEINPSHPLIAAMARRVEAGTDDAGLSDAAHLLFDQARLLEGETVDDPAALAARLTRLMLSSLER